MKNSKVAVAELEAHQVRKEFKVLEDPTEEFIYENLPPITV